MKLPNYGLLMALAVAGCTGHDKVCSPAPAVPYAEPARPSWRPASWKLSPEAAKLVSEWNRQAYVPKQDRTDFLVRAQLKYGINRSDYIHGWYDRPLLQDSSLGQRIDSPGDPRPWLNPGSWAKSVEMAHLGKQKGFAVFTCTSNREKVIPLSQAPGTEATILVELTAGMKHADILYRAEQALKMPNSYRIGEKVILTIYPSTVSESTFPQYRKVKAELTARFGDKFAIMPYYSCLDGQRIPPEGFGVKELEALRARLIRYLEVFDGICFGGRENCPNRRYDSWLSEQVLIPIFRSVYALPQFKDKFLGVVGRPGHENSYRWNYGLDSTGTRMLRDTLSDVAKLRPDFFVGAEWDEENENTCYRPMVAHGFTHQRLLRYFNDLINRGGQMSVFPGDDGSLPNLIISYRKELLAGEPLEVEVLNIPDGTFDGKDITVRLALKRVDGTVAREFEPRRLKGSELMAAVFAENVSQLVADPVLMPELTIAARGKQWVVKDGLWPVGLHPTRCIEYKWAKQPIRDLPKDIEGSLTQVAAAADGVLTLRGQVESSRKLRSIAVLDEADTVYMYDGHPSRDADSVRVRIAFQANAENGKKIGLKGTIRLDGAPHAQLRIMRMRGNIAVKGQTYVLSGAMYNNWAQMLIAEIPLAELPSGEFAVDIPGYFSGKIALKDLYAREVMGLSGPKGGNLVFTIFRSQEDIPPPQLVNAADFTFKLKPGLKNSILRLETVDEDYHVWRSAPFVVNTLTGRKIDYHVYERDADKVSKVTVDVARLDPVEFKFEPSHGSVIASASNRNLWGIMGGAATLVSGFGYGESGYGNTSSYFMKGLTRVGDGYEVKGDMTDKNYPEYVKESDGSWSLQFTGHSYLSLAQQLWPTHAGFALELEVCPKEVKSKQGLMAIDMQGTALWIEKGRVYANFFLRNYYHRDRKYAHGVLVEGPAIAADKWQTVRLVFDQHTAHIEVDGVRGAATELSGDIYYPMYSCLGLCGKGAFYTGRMKSIKVEVR